MNSEYQHACEVGRLYAELGDDAELIEQLRIDNEGLQLEVIRLRKLSQYYLQRLHQHGLAGAVNGHGRPLVIELPIIDRRIGI